MQPQLFLFDEESGNDNPDAMKKDVVPASEKLAGGKNFAGTIAKEDDKDGLPPDEKDAAGENKNPFAEVQQQQQDKVDMLLLKPGRKRGRKSFKDMDEEAILPEIPDDEVLFRKQYYPTRVVAEWFGVTLSQLRAWENEFAILKPKKNGKGDRFFRPEDVKNLKMIYHLIRVRKFTVQGAKQYMADDKKKLQTTMQLTESLNKFKQFLIELKAISG